MKYKIIGNSDEFIISGLDIAIVIEYKTLDTTKFLIDTLLNIIGLNETRSVSFIQDTATIIGFKFKINKEDRIAMIRKLLSNDRNIIFKETNNEGCSIFKISRT